MTTTFWQHPLRALATALVTTAALAGSALPCVKPPLTSPGVCIDTESIQLIPGQRFEVNIYVKGYQLFGGSPGQFCGCALNLPSTAQLCEITEATVVFAGTNVPIPGFGDWQDTHDGDEAWNLIQNGNWFAFSAPVTLPLSTTLDVDICFKIVGKFPAAPGTLETRDAKRPRFESLHGSGIAPGTSEIAEIFDIVTEALQGATIGTDEANALGEPLGAHTGLITLGAVANGELNFSSLGGGVDGSNGQVPLFGDGTMTVAGGAGFARLNNALPNALGVMTFGFATQALPYFGGTFIPTLDVTVALSTDSLGEFALPFPAMPTVAVGADVYMQYWYPDVGSQQGFAGSNALATKIQP